MQAICAPKRRHGGFTLIEAAIATVVVGMGIVALLHAMGAGTRVNHEGSSVTQAVFLGQEIREWTMQLPFSDLDPGDAGNPPGSDGSDSQVFVDDLDDLMNVTYSPPRDGQGYVIDGMDGWYQTISIEWKDPANLTLTVPAGSTDTVSVTVTVGRNAHTALSTSWLVTRRP